MEGNIYFGGYSSVIRDMVARSGKSLRRVSRDMGRADNYLSVMLRNDSVPSASLLAEIASACGLSLALVGDGVAYVFAPSNEFEVSTDYERGSTDEYTASPSSLLAVELEETGRDVHTVMPTKASESGTSTS